ncbi:MAG: His/Gly/Thr/Pro-type tRNA ligase C-terminal domain-containing protein [Candidatus Thiodiazotropha sp.]
MSLAQNSEEKAKADAVYKALQDKGREVLYDNREKISPGAKFSESDLIGIPTRMIVSPRSLKAGVVEIKNRKTREVREAGIESLLTDIEWH